MAIEVPSASLDEVRAALRDRNKLVYLVIAASDATAWDIALALEQDIVGAYSVRFQNRKDAGEWINDTGKVAAVTGWDGKVRTLLTSTQAEDKQFVEDALTPPQTKT